MKWDCKVGLISGSQRLSMDFIGIGEIKNVPKVAARLPKQPSGRCSYVISNNGGNLYAKSENRKSCYNAHANQVTESGSKTG
jgi:hypothetical protein